MQGYVLTQKQCETCQMPMMEKDGLNECVVCPLVKKKAKKRALLKRREMKLGSNPTSPSGGNTPSLSAYLVSEDTFTIGSTTVNEDVLVLEETASDVLANDERQRKEAALRLALGFVDLQASNTMSTLDPGDGSTVHAMESPEKPKPNEHPTPTNEAAPESSIPDDSEPVTSSPSKQIQSAPKKEPVSIAATENVDDETKGSVENDKGTVRSMGSEGTKTEDSLTRFLSPIWKDSSLSKFLWNGQSESGRESERQPPPASGSDNVKAAGITEDNVLQPLPTKTTNQAFGDEEDKNGANLESIEVDVGQSSVETHSLLTLPTLPSAKGSHNKRGITEGKPSSEMAVPIFRPTSSPETHHSNQPDSPSGRSHRSSGSSSSPRRDRPPLSPRKTSRQGSRPLSPVEKLTGSKGHRTFTSTGSNSPSRRPEPLVPTILDNSEKNGRRTSRSPGRSISSDGSPNSRRIRPQQTSLMNTSAGSPVNALRMNSILIRQSTPKADKESPASTAHHEGLDHTDNPDEADFTFQLESAPVDDDTTLQEDTTQEAETPVEEAPNVPAQYDK